VTRKHEIVNRRVTKSRKATVSESRRSEAGGGSGASSRKAAGAAVGGDQGPPLVMIANNSSAQSILPVFQPVKAPEVCASDRRVAKDRARKLIAETCGDLPEAKRLRACGRNVQGDSIGDITVKRHAEGYAFTTVGNVKRDWPRCDHLFWPRFVRLVLSR